MKPILFNTEMVQAILDGRKTVTRRVVMPHRKATIENMWLDKNDGDVVVVYNDNYHIGEKGYIKQPYQPGDILYVRETWGAYETWNGHSYAYKADYTDAENEKKAQDLVRKWRPSIHMPKEAARIFLRVTNVRVERLQEMNGNDLEREGIKTGITHFKSQFNNFGNAERYDEAMRKFGILWDSTIKPSDLDTYGWDANPWVWVIEFEQCEKPIFQALGNLEAVPKRCPVKGG